jgi:diguanylate cyclase (GGDEF)-like protein
VAAGPDRRLRSDVRPGRTRAAEIPGATPEHAAEVAEDLRAAIEQMPVAGLHVTMSFGVSASPPGEFDYESVFAEADMALYEAKHAGRNRVRTRDAIALAAQAA